MIGKNFKYYHIVAFVVDFMCAFGVSNILDSCVEIFRQKKKWAYLSRVFQCKSNIIQSGTCRDLFSKITVLYDWISIVCKQTKFFNVYRTVKENDGKWSGKCILHWFDTIYWSQHDLRVQTIANIEDYFERKKKHQKSEATDLIQFGKKNALRIEWASI